MDVGIGHPLLMSVTQSNIGHFYSEFLDAEFETANLSKLNWRTTKILHLNFEKLNFLYAEFFNTENLNCEKYVY